jgi:transcription elongation factor GreB
VIRPNSVELPHFWRILGDNVGAQMAKNYITPLGWRAIIDELTQLITVERPRVVREVSDAAAEGDRSENAAYIYGKRRLREIDRRAGFLQRRLELVEVVDGRKQSRERVFFGAVVKFDDADSGEPVTYQIVGVDEVDAKVGKVSWQSPIGRAVLGKRIGDLVRVRWTVRGDQGGERELEVTAIDYLDDPPPGDTAAARARFASAAELSAETPSPAGGEDAEPEQPEQQHKRDPVVPGAVARKGRRPRSR